MENCTFCTSQQSQKATKYEFKSGKNKIILIICPIAWKY